MRSLSVSLVVGTLLNGINQGPDLIDGDQISLAKACMTYLVPYCVATYGAVSALLANGKKA